MTGSDVSTQQALQFELRGSHLIEASAGTGKTWTIAALYLRLILGHGGQPPRLPSQILVLTFTEAATLELRDRIRARLSLAALGFADQGSEPEDAFLAGLRGEYPQEQWPALARLLELAAQSMDEAAIFTIHGWCQRVLREHAFDSGSLFELNLQPDLEEPIRQVAWDYWRSEVAGLPPALLKNVLGIWSGPDQLLAFKTLLTRDGLPSAPQQPLVQVCGQVQSERTDRLHALKQPWDQGADELGAWLESIRAGLPRYNATHVQRWLGDLRAWARDPAMESLDLKTGWNRLSPDGIAAWWAGAGPAPEHPRSRALAELRHALADLPGFRAPLTQHVLGWMAERLRRELALTALMGFDGLLTSLASALRGHRGPVLAQTLRRQFPVALIDEFQDTDPLQYQIFDCVYGVARNDPESSVVLIGDPKQAIYGFRGADVHTYLKAARDCGDRVRTLGRNYRSSIAMVKAVNAFFESAAGEVFVTGNEEEHIAFHSVAAQGTRECWRQGGVPGTALSAAWLASGDPGKPLAVGAYREQAAAQCAARVAAWLHPGSGAGFLPAQGARLEPVRPRDIAVLVNTHSEASMVRAALASQGIRSVYLSERESVYESPLALELAVCLQACARPEDERAVRAASATPLLGLSVARLQCLVDDESAWDQQVERFQAYHRCWRERGVLPALRRLLQDFEVPARLLAAGHEGERQLTDCLHLAELLQQASLHLDGEQALLRFLQQQRESSTDEDARHLRLESDDALVRVVTVHKSKGLEYPLVFLPFVCAGGAAPRRMQPVRLEREGQTVWVADPDEAESEQLARERLGEEVRKLYVALTRARHAVWLALGEVEGLSHTGVGHVLGGDLRAAWGALVESQAPGIAWDADELPVDALALPLASEPPLGPARTLAGPVVAQPWWIASYSALRLLDDEDFGRARGLAAPETAQEDVLREVQRQQGPHDDTPAGPVAALADFPRGSEAGTFLHGLLEWAGRRSFRGLDEARDLIARRCQVRGWEAHIDALHAWLTAFAATVWRANLPERPTWRFDALPACQPELEFWLPVHQVEAGRLDELITRSVFAGRPRPPLAPARLNGMFKGFIDLALQIEGRWYLVDYKSNDLGPGAADYAPDALAQAMCAARYDVQLTMYVLALHRQLRARLPDYDYDRHLGGALYLFLRGQAAPGQGVCALRPARGLIESLDALFEGHEDEDPEEARHA